MTLVRTSPSGPNLDVSGTALPPGDYDGEPLVWNGVDWVQSNTIRVAGIEAPTPAEGVQITNCDHVFLLPTGEFAIQALGNTNFLTMTAVAGTSVSAPIITLLDTTAVNFLRITDSQWEGVGTIANLSSPSGSGVNFDLNGVQLGAATGQTLVLSVNGAQRIFADDTVAGISAEDSSVFVNAVGTVDIATPGSANINGSTSISLSWSAGAVNMSVAGLSFDSSLIGFFGTAPAARPAITGVSTQQQVDSLVSALVALGLVTDAR